MIFNVDEVIKVLRECEYDSRLTNKELQVIRTLIVYLDNQEPKLTYDEFKALFTCNVNYLNEETLEIEVHPKHKIYMHVDKSLSWIRARNQYIEISPEIEDHLYQVAHMEFMNQVKELKQE